MAYWVGSFDTTGANTAVKFVISGIKMLILAMDFFAGNAAWSWAYDVMAANSDCEYLYHHSCLADLEWNAVPKKGYLRARCILDG